jgi:hypothetical protein
MTASALGRARQVFLLCALALGIVGMHHLPTSDDMMRGAVPTVASAVLTSTSHDMPGYIETLPSPAVGQHPTAPMPSHDLMHLCLAVMCAVGFALAALWLLLRVARSATPSGSSSIPRRARAPDRPPDRHGRLLLTAFCILRV